MKRSSSFDVDPRPLLSKESTSSQSELDHYLGQSQPVVPNKHSRILYILLILSSALNVVLITVGLVKPFPRQLRSSYAQLDTASLTVSISENTDYANANLTEGWALWAAIDFDAGIIALPNSWAMQKGIPKGLTFPWDNDKSLYLLHGHHQLHCLKNIYRSLREFKEGMDQSMPLEHITHCFDSLRTDIICKADDTPRYVAGGSSSGVGQARQCRDWSKLDEWAKERTACFNYIGPKAYSLNQYKRYQFCPKDSPYWPAVRAQLGKPDDWFGEDDDEIKAMRVH